MKILTDKLVDHALDLAVARCENLNVTGFRTGVVFIDGEPGTCHLGRSYTPHSDWAQGGEIIDRKDIDLDCAAGRAPHVKCRAVMDGATPDTLGHMPRVDAYGPTKLIAAMRCYVKSQMGDYVVVPDAIALFSADESVITN